MNKRQKKKLYKKLNYKKYNNIDFFRWGVSSSSIARRFKEIV